MHPKYGKLNCRTTNWKYRKLNYRTANQIIQIDMNEPNNQRRELLRFVITKAKTTKVD